MGKLKISESYIIGFDITSEDEAVMTVAKSTGSKLQFVNTVVGVEAKELYAKLTIKDIEYSVEPIEFDSVIDAENTLKQLNSVIVMYGRVTVAEMYELLRRTPKGAKDFKRGWTYLAHARIRKENQKFILDLPKTIELN